MGSLSVLVNRMVHWCRDVSLGYSQSDRWNIRPGGNCDCSSLVIHCLQEAGFDTGSASYTGNMSAQLCARGWRRLSVNRLLQPGDILLNDVHHVAVYIGNNQLAQASISEHGTAYGSGGDQTGGETNIRTYYSYPWNCILRYAGEETDMPLTQTDLKNIANAVWNFNQNGTLMRDRVQGTDAASNGANQEIHRLSKWDDKTHFSPLGNLVARFPIEYGTGKNKTKAALADRIAYIDQHTHVVDTRLAAMSAAIEALSKSIGADPDTIGQAVETAVKAKLDALDIKVTAE